MILNRVEGSRHAAVSRKSIEEYCGIPVLGMVPRIAGFPFPERHLGLIPPQEHDRLRKALEPGGDIAEEYLDMDG